MEKSEVPFTALFTDQSLEQEIKDLKGHGGLLVSIVSSPMVLDLLACEAVPQWFPKILPDFREKSCVACAVSWSAIMLKDKTMASVR